MCNVSTLSDLGHLSYTLIISGFGVQVPDGARLSTKALTSALRGWGQWCLVPASIAVMSPFHGFGAFGSPTPPTLETSVG
jgi:hypothetical protein